MDGEEVGDSSQGFAFIALEGADEVPADIRGKLYEKEIISAFPERRVPDITHHLSLIDELCHIIFAKITLVMIIACLYIL